MIESIIKEAASSAFSDIYGTEIPAGEILIQKTRREFEGDYTINVFPYLKYTREKPEATAEKIGNHIAGHADEIEDYSVVKGFLNMTVADKFWLGFLSDNFREEDFGKRGPVAGKAIVIEYSSPNTNKPLHLGHIRNNLLGWSVAEILKANGREVIRVNLVNDRGIHICKSMLAWEKWYDNITPDQAGLKGDKLVGECYVRFDRELRDQVTGLMEGGESREEAEMKAPLMSEAREMLKKWENNDRHVRELWQMMNAWVYAGFDITYNRLGIDFDKIYYESETYLLGKEIVQQGLNDKVFYKKDDGSVWADLSDEGLDEKLLLRADGTSVYITQDLGTAQLRYDEFQPGGLLYVVGNEQNYHFDVLRILLLKLGKEWAQNIEHISYGMVELPQGKMKSREGTVVDADDLMDQMEQTAESMARELGKADELGEEEARELFRTISLGALKYFILRVDPKKNMLFNPGESIDFNGHTGPFIQYTYARIRSLLKKAEASGMHPSSHAFYGEMLDKEKEIIKILYTYPSAISEAAQDRSPAVIAAFAYDLAREYNQFYQEINILREKDAEKARYRLALSQFTAVVIRSAMGLLGIRVPEKM